MSQGRPDAFDLELWNGRRRSVSSVGDNNNVWGGGTSTAPVVFPGVADGPEFLRSTLPVEAMTAPSGQPFTVRVNRSVVEIPDGSDTHGDQAGRSDGGVDRNRADIVAQLELIVRAGVAAPA